MNALLIKRLFKVIQSGSTTDIDAVCRRIVDEEKRQGHGRVAKQLEDILGEKSAADSQVGNLRQSALLAETPQRVAQRCPVVESLGHQPGSIPACAILKTSYSWYFLAHTPGSETMRFKQLHLGESYAPRRDRHWRSPSAS